MRAWLGRRAARAQTARSALLERIHAPLASGRHGGLTAGIGPVAVASLLVAVTCSAAPAFAATSAVRYLVSASDYDPIAGISVTISAQLVDPSNNPVAQSGIIVTWAKTGAGGSLGSATSATGANGVATVVFATDNSAGTAYVITALDASGLTGTTSTIRTVAGMPTKFVLTSTSYSAVAGSTVTISAQLADSNNNPVGESGVVVTWSSSGTGGSFASITSTTDAYGHAPVAFTTGSTAGVVQTISATDLFGRTGTSAPITTVGTPTKYIVTSTTYSPVAGTSVTISAQLADSSNNPVGQPGRVVTWSQTGLGGSFASATSTTAVNGLAMVVFTTATTSGRVYTITATDSSNRTGISPAITAVVGPPAKYLVASTSYNPPVDSNVTVSAQLVDTNDNAVALAGVIVNWSTSGSGGSFASPTSATDGLGVAPVVFTTGGTPGTAYTITAADALGRSGASSTIMSVGPPVKYLVVASSYSPPAGTGVTITAQLADAGDRAVSQAGIVVTWSSTGVGGSFAEAISATNSNGAAKVVFTTSTSAGIGHAITAIDASNRTGTSATITTTAAKYLVSSTSFSPIAGTSVTISAQLADAAGQPVAQAGIVVTWSKTGAGGSFASTTSTTNDGGVATVVFTTGTAGGTLHTITATDTAGRKGTSSAITTGAPATQYLITTNNFSPSAGSAVTISVQLATATKAPVAQSGVVVTWSNTGAGGSFASATSTTNASGTASVLFTTGMAGTVYTITVSDTSGRKGTSAAITVVLAASKYVVTASSYSPAPGAKVTINAQLADGSDKPVPLSGVAVTWISYAIDGSFAAATSTTNASGLATVVFTTGATVARTYAIEAHDQTGRQGTSPPIATVAATKFVVTSSSKSPSVGATLKITAQLTDASGRPIGQSGIVVRWSKTGAGGSFASGTSTTNANGVATVVFVAGTTAGTIYVFTATDTSGRKGTSAVVKIAPSSATTRAAAASALGVSRTGRFTDSTKLSRVGGYVTFKFVFGQAYAGRKIEIWAARKNSGGAWSPFTRITSRVADSNGTVFYSVRASSPTWKSFRAVFNRSGSLAARASVERQARWL